MIIRKTEENELETIFSLTPQAIFDGTMGEVRPSDAKAESLVKPLLERGSFYFVAVEEEQILGWILLGTAKDQFTEQVHGFIYELFVLNEFRGNGYSKGLMAAAIEHFQKEGYAEVRLSAKVENPAVHLYEKLGFKPRTVSMALNLE